MICEECEFSKDGHCTVGMCAYVRAQYIAKGLDRMLPPWQQVLVPKRKKERD